MQAFPHHYRVRAEGRCEGPVSVTADGVDALPTTAPPEFGGPEGYWSPESLLVAAIADCFVLSFRAVARASKLPWRELQVEVEGVLDRVEGVTQFTAFTISPRLALEPGASEALAQTVLAKSKRACLITNSLKAECDVEAELVA
jgi:organic hydroperoxide reductase OsmC/OhrA